MITCINRNQKKATICVYLRLKFDNIAVNQVLNYLHIQYTYYNKGYLIFCGLNYNEESNPRRLYSLVCD